MFWSVLTVERDMLGRAEHGLWHSRNPFLRYIALQCGFALLAAMIGEVTRGSVVRPTSFHRHLAAGDCELCRALRPNAEAFGRREILACIAAPFLERCTLRHQLSVDQFATSFGSPL